MLTEIGTAISSLSLLLQLYDNYQNQKIKNYGEYKSNLKLFVSSLYFSKSIHHFSHTILDLNYTDLFKKDLAEIGLLSFQNSFRTTFGYLIDTQILTTINPSLSYHKSQIMEEVKKFEIRGYSNSFISSVSALNHCYPSMITNYEELSREIIKIKEQLYEVNLETGINNKIYDTFENNKKYWGFYIEQKSRDILTFADQSIMNGITILDTLFVI